MEGCSGQLLPPAGQVRPATAAHGKGPLKSTESTVMGGRSSGDPLDASGGASVGKS